MATTTTVAEPRVSAVSATASRIDGIDMSPSITRMITGSRRRTKPDHGADQHAERTRQRRHGEADAERDAGAVQGARIHVAAQHVGAEEGFGGRRAQPARRCQLRRIDGAEPGREDGDGEHGDEERPPDDHQGVAVEDPCAAAAAPGRGQHVREDLGGGDAGWHVPRRHGAHRRILGSKTV